MDKEFVELFLSAGADSFAVLDRFSSILGSQLSSPISVRAVDGLESTLSSTLTCCWIALILRVSVSFITGPKPSGAWSIVS